MRRRPETDRPRKNHGHEQHPELLSSSTGAPVRQTPNKNLWNKNSPVAGLLAAQSSDGHRKAISTILEAEL